MNTPAPVFDRLISVSTKPGQVQVSQRLRAPKATCFFHFRAPLLAAFFLSGLIPLRMVPQAVHLRGLAPGRPRCDDKHDTALDTLRLIGPATPLCLGVEIRKNWRPAAGIGFSATSRSEDTSAAALRRADAQLGEPRGGLAVTANESHANRACKGHRDENPAELLGEQDHAWSLRRDVRVNEAVAVRQPKERAHRRWRC
jgi:hypothetical protein